MAILKLIGMAGEIPKIISRALPNTAAQIAFNTRLDDGGLTPIRKAGFEYSFPSPPPGGYDTIYKHAGTWYGWEGNVKALPGPVATDRLYVFGDGLPKMISGGTTYDLKIAGPSGALTSTLGGVASSDLGSTRIYVFTWVTAFGEESEPSPASNEVYWKPGQTVTLSGFPATPAGRNITKQRIYRSQTSLTGTKLYFIAERNAATSNYVDSIATDAFGEALPSADWTLPTDTLEGVIALPGGGMVGFDGKEICFCEPYRPHAWPDKYKLTADYPIVGLGAYGSTIVVATEGNPYIITGSAPELMVMEKLELNLPCINPRSIVDLGYSVAYASHDGLVMVSNGGAKVASETLIARDDWLRLNPGSMTAGQYDGRYFTTYNYSDVNGQEFKGTIIFDMTGEQPFIIRTDYLPRAMYYEIETGLLHMLLGDSVYIWDSISEPFSIQNWKSKIFVVPRPTNFGAILVESDTALTPDQIAILEAERAAAIAANTAIFGVASIGGELNGSAINVYEINGDELYLVPIVSQFFQVNVYADRKLVATVGKINEMCRLPSGFMAQLWEIEVTSDGPITQVTMATTGAELMGA